MIMKELSKDELKQVEGGIAHLPWWVKGSVWGFVIIELTDHWSEIKSGFADGWADAMSS